MASSSLSYVKILGVEKHKQGYFITKVLSTALAANLITIYA